MAMTAPALSQLPARVVSVATGAYRVRLDDLAAVMDVLGDALAPRARLAWLTSRSAYLGWQRPVDVLAAGGFERVRGAALAYAGGDVT